MKTCENLYITFKYHVCKVTGYGLGNWGSIPCKDSDTYISSQMGSAECLLEGSARSVELTIRLSSVAERGKSGRVPFNSVPLYVFKALYLAIGAT
jgi:hypothetical protein